jgi:flagellar biosynthesis/type III secretory pathway M-ring protein FliF/YscJ
MIALAGKKAFWKNNAFWIVVMPTVLVGFVFLVAFVAKAVG